MQLRSVQLDKLKAFVDSVRLEVEKAAQDNVRLVHRREELIGEQDNLNIRLKAILKEKELLFSRLMSVERDILKLSTS